MKNKLLAVLFVCALCVCAAFVPGKVWADVKIDKTNFPDDNFRNWVKENAAEGADVLKDAQAAAVSEMDISFGEISDLKGLEHFTALTELTCWSNSLKTLDTSKNAALEILRCNGNELTKLDLSKNTALKGLFCDQNEIAALDLSALSNLYALSCRYNGIKALDLSHNSALVELDCWGNELTTLDLSKNAALVKLNCLENPIKELDLSNNPNLSEVSLPTTAAVTLPNGDNIVMNDFKVAKGKEGKFSLDLSKYGDKIGEVRAEPEGPDEVNVTSAKGVYTFAPFGGRLIVSYRLGGDSVLDLILYVEGEL